ncbi:Aminopeptidase [Acidisarcina polymorpha]|uniref:Carboxypeptidase Q n=1 Tax=Acidisarcina polymorpha TaxID=2211140 RepID=A0A2Z5FZD1_9BACT|nr:M20/M25/M40 family metallo-hydrolase [Acidisarcina polymorpha]AXC11894.1 Aminopeptidase [Acidisarcina polymorpha]
MEQIATMNRLRDEALRDPFAYDRLSYLTDTIGPRLSGSTQASAAVEWVAAQMRALGADVMLEKTAVPHWVRGEETAFLTDWPNKVSGATQKIVLTALGNSVATAPSGVSAAVIVVHSFAELRALPAGAVKGKIVLFDVSFDKAMTAQGQGIQAYLQTAPYRVVGPSVAAKLGAIAVLVRSLGSADLRTAHTGTLLYTEGVEKIPAAAVTAEDADLLARLARQGPITIHLTLTPQTLPLETSYNVIADWKGSENPEQMVIVSGHLDSWDLGTGATDDGAGIVTAMQTIQLLQALNIHPRRTIRFIAWMNEEFGASGAATYGKEHSVEFGNHVAAMESDLGCDHPTGLYLSDPALEAFLAPVADALKPIGAGSLTTISELPSEDLAPMIAAGVPSLAPIQDLRSYFNYHHTAADTLDKVDRQHLQENAAVIAVTAYAFADASKPAPRSK